MIFSIFKQLVCIIIYSSNFNNVNMYYYLYIVPILIMSIYKAYLYIGDSTFKYFNIKLIYISEVNFNSI